MREALALATAQGQGQEEGLSMPHTDADAEESLLDDAVTSAIATVIDGDGDGNGDGSSNDSGGAWIPLRGQPTQQRQQQQLQNMC